MKIINFKFDDWENQWASSWSLLSVSYWGDLYSRRPFTKKIDRYVNHTIIMTREGESAAYQRSSEKSKFGRKFNALVLGDQNYISRLCHETEMITDKFLAYAKSYYKKDISFKKYLEFQNLLVNLYYPLHIQIKVGVDYLDELLLSKYLSKIESTRIYIEPVFDQSEKFMREFAKIHAKKTNIDFRLILSTTNNEFHDYFRDGKTLPSVNVLEKRSKAAGVLYNNGKSSSVFVGQQVSSIEKLIVSSSHQEIIPGISAYAGKVTGRVKIILNPNKPHDLKPGDILVAGMTRPDYLSLMKTAGGFITDGGGILCHAAIVARELKNPASSVPKMPPKY